MNFTGKEIEIIKGEHKGEKGFYLGTDGYTGAGVVCKVLIDNNTYSFIWNYFRFINEEVQRTWDSEDDLKELDFDY